MAAQGMPPIPPYEVTSIVPFDDIDSLGHVVPSHRINFTTADGIASSVPIPNTLINDVVAGKALIDARIVALTAYKALGKK